MAIMAYLWNEKLAINCNQIPRKAYYLPMILMEDSRLLLGSYGFRGR